MGIDFIKETTDRLAKAFIGYDLEKPLSEDLPDNIKEIDRVVGEAYMEGKIKFDESYKDTKEKLESLLKSKRVMPEWDLDDLCLKVIDRFTRRTHSWDFGLAERHAEDLAVYEELKDRPCVKRIVEITGTDYIPSDTLLSITWIPGIDSDRSEGKTYADIYSDFFQDNTSAALIFLNHLEDTSNATIHTVEQFQNLLGDLDEREIETCSRVLFSAFEERYDLTLNRILREGGKYEKLLAITPTEFNLPDTWHGSSEGMTKDKMILKAIADYFNLSEPDYTAVRHLSIRDIANQLEAPYPEILKATRYYQEHFYGFENEAS